MHLFLSELAAGMKETTDAVKAALDETERAQSVAMDAIELAKNNTKGTMDLLVSVRDYSRNLNEPQPKSCYDLEHVDLINHCEV